MSFPEPADRRAGWGLMLIFGLLVTGIVVAGFFYYRYFEQNHLALVERKLSAIADLKVNELAHWRQERQADGAVFFKNVSFSGLVRDLFEHPEDSQAQRRIQAWVEKFPTMNQYDHVCLLDTQGVTRLSVPAGRPAASSAVAQNIAEVLRSGQVMFQDFYRSDNDPQVHLGVAVPILDDQDANRSLGVLMLRIDPEKYLYPAIQRWPTPSLTAETLLVRREGSEVVFLNELRFQTNTALNLRGSLDAPALPAAQAALGREGILEGIDYRGVPVVAALRTIPDSPWALVARMDVAEVYGPLRGQLWQVVVIIGSLIFGAGAGVGLVWRQRSVRFYREQAAASEAIRETKGYLENLINHANAPIIVWDPQFRITRFNHAFEALTGRKAEDLVGGTLEVLFPPAQMASSMELIKHALAGELWETVEISILHLDGSVRIVLWNSATILAADGQTPVATIAQGQDITERKRAEEALQQEKAFADELLNAPRDTVFLFEPATGQPIRWNKRFVEVSGYDDAELVRMKAPDDFYTAEDVQRVRAGLGKVTAEGQGVVTLSLVTKRGTRIPYEYTVTVVETVDGKTLLLAIGRDVTERQRAEAALRASEERFRIVAETANDVVYEWDLQQRVEWQGKIDELLGYAPGEFPRTLDGWAAAVHPEDLERTRAAVQAQLEGRAPYAAEYRVRGKDGVYRWWSARGAVAPTPEGKPARWIGSITDITERKRAEQALRESEERFRRAVVDSPFPMLLHAEDGAIIEASNSWSEITGYTREELVTIADWTERAYGERKVLVQADIERLYGLDHRVAEGDYTIRTKSGGTRIWEFSSAPLGRLPDGRRLVISMAMDVTERRQAEERLGHSLADLERSNKELEQFAYVASHDLQEPLRMISSYTQLLAQRYEGQLDDKAQKYIHYAVDGAVRMQTLINDLLAYSRVGTRGQRLEPTDSHAVLGEALRNLTATIEEHHAIITNDDLPLVPADASQLVLVFQNLLSNAIKFRREDGPRIHVSAQDRGREWTFSVRDNGIGIEPQHAERVFVLFQRLHTRAEYPGTGIGLTICKRIVERHGGRIWFESEPGNGATFFFTVPK